MKMNNRLAVGVAIVTILLLGTCKKEEAEPRLLSLLSQTINGVTLVDGLGNVDINTHIELVFSNQLEPARFEQALSLTSDGNEVDLTIAYANQSSKANITAGLEPDKAYVLSIENLAIAQNGASLSQAMQWSFTTVEMGSTPSACTSGCLQTAPFSIDGATASFDFYTSFPLFEPGQVLDNIRSAIIVVHGANQNAGDYFNYMIATLKAMEKEQETVLIAPHFQPQAEATAGDYFWTGNGWREGQPSGNAVKASSFELVDSLVMELAIKERFPALEQIIVTGHSSGGLFTHLYAAANTSESILPEINFTYIVANSQYFYYPDGRRIDENNNQLYTPSGCTGYDFWPLGYAVLPPYLSDTVEADFNEQFVNREIVYLLGNGNGADGALNTTDCSATLLGLTRFSRGQNMFRYMELVYPSVHQHSRVIVEGIGHDGQGMYQSETFRVLLGTYLN